MNNEEVNFEAVVGPDFPNQVIPLIHEAKKSIKIIVFDWRWYPNNLGGACQLFNNAIIRAAQRDVRVDVMTNAFDLIKILRLNKISAKKPQSKKLLHSKLMIIDDEILVIGSHNYTQNAFTVNQEISIILRAKNQLDRFIKYFDAVCQS